METSFKKSTERLNSCTSPWKERYEKKGKQETDETQEVPKCMFICVVAEYGNREVCRLVAGEADVFCLSTGQLTALKVPTIIIPERSSSLKTALFWQGSSSLGGHNRKAIGLIAN